MVSSAVCPRSTLLDTEVADLAPHLHVQVIPFIGGGIGTVVSTRGRRFPISDPRIQYSSFNQNNASPWMNGELQDTKMQIGLMRYLGLYRSTYLGR